MTGPDSAPRVTEGMFAAFSVAIPMAAIFLLSRQWPDVLWERDLQTTEVIVAIFGSCVALAAFLAAEKLVLRSVPSILPAFAALLLTSAIYGAIQGTAYWIETDVSRQAERSAATWPVVLTNTFDQDEPMPGPERSQFGIGRTEIRDGRLVVTLESARDLTYPWPRDTPS